MVQAGGCQEFVGRILPKIWIITLTVTHLALLQSSAFAAISRAILAEVERVSDGNTITAITLREFQNS